MMAFGNLELNSAERVQRLPTFFGTGAEKQHARLVIASAWRVFDVEHNPKTPLEIPRGIERPPFCTGTGDETILHNSAGQFRILYFRISIFDQQFVESGQIVFFRLGGE